MQIRSLAAALLLAAQVTTANGQQPALGSEHDKTLYALGQAIGENLSSSIAPFALTDEEMALVVVGIGDALRGNESRVDLEAYMPRVQALAQERAAAAERREAEAAAAEKEAAKPFLERMAHEPGAERTASGLIFIPITAGTGASPTATDIVNVHYHGTLRDGTVFDSSVDRGQPISFPLDGVIPCWTEGLQKMKVGGKAKLVCPPEIAYGDRAVGSIPAGAALVFEVELLGIE
ncbi:MAG TPA: FKBP-type peptidyl-prolyl cis-trans isomerase [Gammaproteobacteria bacterium]